MSKRCVRVSVQFIFPFSKVPYKLFFCSPPFFTVFFLACRALNPPWCIKAGQGDESIEEGERQCRQNVDWMVCLSDLWMPDMGHQPMQQCSQCHPLSNSRHLFILWRKRENLCEHHGHNHLNTQGLFQTRVTCERELLLMLLIMCISHYSLSQQKRPLTSQTSPLTLHLQ